MNRDITLKETELYFIPVTMRFPLCFGGGEVSSVTCLRVKAVVEEASGSRSASGWGETPLNIQWAWPGEGSFSKKEEALKEFSVKLSHVWINSHIVGHPFEITHQFIEEVLPEITENPVPYLATLLCCSAFDLAIHDAYGKLHEQPVYGTYNREFMNRDLSWFFNIMGKSADSSIEENFPRFSGRYPEDYLSRTPKKELLAWHLVGERDPLSPEELTGEEPEDGYPLLLEDWIKRDGLLCLKIKLNGIEEERDYNRLVRVGKIAERSGVLFLSADFNCCVGEPEYLIEVLNRLGREEPEIYKMLLYIEQPFPYDLEKYPIDTHKVSRLKPLFMDESAFHWRRIKPGKDLGWTGVGLKTCKTQTESILSLCLAREMGLQIMVQDLTNPMLAQISHVLLAAHGGTIMGVETNSMQFCPQASETEARVHPGLYRRREGKIDLSTVRGYGFGYRIEEMGGKMSEHSLEGFKQCI